MGSLWRALDGCTREDSPAPYLPVHSVGAGGGIGQGNSRQSGCGLAD